MTQRKPPGGRLLRKKRLLKKYRRMPRYGPGIMRDLYQTFYIHCEMTRICEEYVRRNLFLMFGVPYEIIVGADSSLGYSSAKVNEAAFREQTGIAAVERNEDEKRTN